MRKFLLILFLLLTGCAERVNPQGAWTITFFYPAGASTSWVCLDYPLVTDSGFVSFTDIDTGRKVSLRGDVSIVQGK